MKSIKVIAHQSLFDIALEKYGSVRAAFAIAYTNGLEIAQPLTPGQELVLPESVFTIPDIVRYFEGKQHKIATSNVTDKMVSPQLEGIDYWAIQVDFQIQ
ncbi:hypothetical protein HMPREF0765_4148 [Sphingobacterium spiritivorum ATCC 33300]|uniref:LysM domain-containing protein n=1 Tax=Sphingobacterium spiritivorum ATCC 33300 TaxID=525372 RepID=C2G3J2_SPHSI|nr:hypothetical protein [Sphingobacterium spiritivorum]EEI90197.1 hypothetical protein HMPREF0765_4148 [Sphingobacterium spiritivorum ATCC 33300]QQS95166.1 hypothetical protein I6J03_17550 [Sphingobacterium spiritivorum]